MMLASGKRLSEVSPQAEAGRRQGLASDAVEWTVKLQLRQLSMTLAGGQRLSEVSPQADADSMRLAVGKG